MISHPVETLLDTRFVKVFDFQYEPGRHYIVATRRERKDLAAERDEAAFRRMTPDAVSLCAVWHGRNGQERILLTREYRYPLGQYVISVPAGLIDPGDRGMNREEAIRAAAIRELFEETGIAMEPQDRFTLLQPCLFSSPGLTDESNAMARIDLFGHGEEELNFAHTEGPEKFEGFLLADREEAGRIMREEPISVYTWIGLAAFSMGQ